MPLKNLKITNFSRSAWSDCQGYRPENTHELETHPANSLARGQGLSYNDSCFNSNGVVIDSQRLNHLLRFDAKTGLVECQPGVKLLDLFAIDPEYIPAVIPGTVHGTVGGAIAHDVHGKNNHTMSSFGHHVEWMDLCIDGKTYQCNANNHGDLFKASIAGLGLTGVISKVGLRLQKASRFVEVEQTKHETLDTLLTNMRSDGLQHDFQVAWLDLLQNTPRAIHSTANFTAATCKIDPQQHSIPRLPFSVIHQWNMKLFNKLYWNLTANSKRVRTLEEFNNPLDKLTHWSRLYRSKGFLQFQAVFPQENAHQTLDILLNLISKVKATPTLAVLKLFTQPGAGLMSFCQPGFTLAIDFINNLAAKEAITSMNNFISTIGGKVYLAKDSLLSVEQFQRMYPNHSEFVKLIAHYQSSMRSDLGKRLGLLS